MDDGFGLVMRDLETQLRRRADAKIRNALEIGMRSVAGFSPAEIRAQLDLSRDEYERAASWLKEAIRATPRDACRK